MQEIEGERAGVVPTVSSIGLFGVEGSTSTHTHQCAEGFFHPIWQIIIIYPVIEDERDDALAWV